MTDLKVKGDYLLKKRIQFQTIQQELKKNTEESDISKIINFDQGSQLTGATVIDEENDETIVVKKPISS